MEQKFLDREGIKYLWSQISLEDYPNNETLVAILNAIDETKADKSEIVKLANSWNNLQDIPETHQFGITYSDTLTWDGNIEDSMFSTTIANVDNMIYYLVSEETPDLHEFTTGIVSDSTGDTTTIDIVDLAEFFESPFPIYAALYADSLPVMVVMTQSATQNGIGYKKGIYLPVSTDGVHITSVQIPGCDLVSVKTNFIDNKLLEFMEVSNGDTLKWDGNTYGLESHLADGCWKVSDILPTYEDLSRGGIMTLTSAQGEQVSMAFTEEDIDLQDFGFEIGIPGTLETLFYIVTVDNGIVGGEEHSKGIYLPAFEGTYTSALTINGFDGFKTAKIKSEYLEGVNIKNKTADWSQNDVTAADYIKNRTHYEVESFVNERVNIENGSLIWEGSGMGSNGEKFLLTTDLGFVVDVNNPPNLEYSYVYYGTTHNETIEWTLIAPNVYFGGTGIDGCELMLALEDNAKIIDSDGTVVLTFESKGLYGPTYDVSGSVSAPGYPFNKNNTEIKTLDVKYLPKHLQFGEGAALIGNVLDWDGEIGYKYSVSLMQDNNGMVATHISDNIPTLADLQKGGSITVVSDILGNSTTAEFTSDMVADLGGALVIGDLSSDTTIYYVAIIQTPNLEYQGVIFQKTGVYFIETIVNNISYLCTTHLSLNGYTFTEKGIKPIEQKYLPESLHFGEVPVTLYGSTKIEDGNLVWDGNSDGMVSAVNNGSISWVVSDDTRLYDFSTITVTYDYRGTVYTYNFSDSTPNYTLITDKFKLFTGGPHDISVAVVTEDFCNVSIGNVTATFPKKGIYLASAYGPYTISVDGFDFTESYIKTIDEKYLPETNIITGTPGQFVVIGDDGKPMAQTITMNKYYKGSEEPDSTLGEDGDLYLVRG